MIDANRIAEAVAKMRCPEVRLHPADVGWLFNVLAPRYETAEERERAEMLAGFARQSPLASVPIIGDPTVPRGQMRVIETESSVAMECIPSVSLPRFDPEPEIDARFDRLCHAATQIKPVEWWGLGIDWGALPARKPWRVVGRRRTRALWGRRGRR